MYTQKKINYANAMLLKTKFDVVIIFSWTPGGDRSNEASAVDLDDIIVVGDIHGDPSVLLRIFKKSDVFEGIDWTSCVNRLLEMRADESTFPENLLDDLKWKSNVYITGRHSSDRCADDACW